MQARAVPDHPAFDTPLTPGAGASPIAPAPVPERPALDSPRRAGRSLHQLRQRQADHAGKPNEGVPGGGLLALLDPDDGWSVDLGG